MIIASVYVELVQRTRFYRSGYDINNRKTQLDYAYIESHLSHRSGSKLTYSKLSSNIGRQVPNKIIFLQLVSKSN